MVWPRPAIPNEHAARLGPLRKVLGTIRLALENGTPSTNVSHTHTRTKRRPRTSGKMGPRRFQLLGSVGFLATANESLQVVLVTRLQDFPGLRVPYNEWLGLYSSIKQVEGICLIW